MMVSLRRLPVALLALLPLLSLHAAPARASAGMEMAVQDDNAFVYASVATREKALKAAEKLHVKRIRVNLLWANLLVGNPRSRKLPKAPAYDFFAVDQLQQEAALRGIKLQLTLAGPAPAWATKNHRVGNDWPNAYRFGQFVTAVAQHFKGRIDRYSIWNEPNWDTWLNPVSHAPGIYRDLYTHAYAAIKHVDKRAQVLIGETSPYGEKHAIPPLRFLRGVTCRTARYTAAKHCAPLRADGYAEHAYQFTVAPNRPYAGPDDAPFGSMGHLTSALTLLAHRRALLTPSGHPLNVYLTEFGYLTKGYRAMPARTRAAWLTEAYKIARRNPRIKEFLQYQLVDGPARNPWHSAVMSRKLVPDAAFRALARVSAR